MKYRTNRDIVFHDAMHSTFWLHIVNAPEAIKNIQNEIQMKKHLEYVFK